MVITLTDAQIPVAVDHVLIFFKFIENAIFEKSVIT